MMRRNHAFALSLGFLVTAFALYFAATAHYELQLTECLTLGLLTENRQCRWSPGIHFGIKFSLVLGLIFLLLGLRSPKQTS